MDQRVKGGSPPKTSVDTTSPPKSSEKDQVPEKKRKGGAEKENGDKGAVLELLIEGRCGTMGDQQLQISGRESSCPEGNVRLRIGLQAKRTKKPPKILESYVCKPTFRTYQRQGRGALLKEEAERGVGQQSKTSSSPDEAISREQHSSLDGVQTTSKQTTSAPPPVSSSSLSTSSSTLQPLSSATTTTTSASAAVSQGTKTTSQVPIKLADNAEVISNSTLEKVNGQSVSVVHTKADGASPTHFPQTPPTEEIKNEASSSKKHNGLGQTSKQKGLSNGKPTADTINAAPSSKNKSGKHSTSSSISKSTQATTNSQKELSYKSKSPSISTVTCQPQHSPTISHAQDTPNPLMQPSPEKKKAKKSKKEKRRDKKSKRDRLEAERAKSQSRCAGSKKRKEKVRDEKQRHGKEKEERHRSSDLRGEEENDKNLDHESQTTEYDNQKNCDNAGSGTVDKDVLVGRRDEQSKAHDNCRTVKYVDPGATGDNNKSKEQDISKHSTVPPSQPFPTVPASLPSTPSRETIFTPSSPSEQDSRPLKKRKSRRPSWTRLVHRVHKAENHEATMDSQHNPSLSFPQNPKISFNPKPTDESHVVTSSSVTNSSSPQPTLTWSPSPKQSHPKSDAGTAKNPVTPTRKRGRPKSQSSSLNEPSPKLMSNTTPTEVPLPGQDQALSPVKLSATEVRPCPRKRGRPPKLPLSGDRSLDALNQGDHENRRKSIAVSAKGNRQLNIKRLINEMRKRKKRRFHKSMSSGFVAKTADAKSIDSTTVHTLSALSTSFGGKLGPQINVSKRGTIYMGKRRGRKPKSQTANSQSSTQSSLFTSAPETSLFSSIHPQPPPSHPFPSPSLTHSSGAQSPYSEGSLTDPTPSLLFSQPFSLPSPSSSCTSPRPPSSSSLTSIVRKSCPCQGRQHFPFHQSTCKLSSPTPPLHHTPGSPGHLKEATTSPRSESHSEETLPSDSGIGTDNNSISERGEMRGNRAMLRVGYTPGIMLGSQKHPTSIIDHASSVSPPLSHMSRHPNPNALIVERHRDRHRHRRRDFDCSSPCMCLCACSGHSKCTHSDFYSCHGHNALKRQKNKHKKKHQQLIHMQDPEFLSELEDLIAQFNDIHIGRRSWAKSGLGQAYEGGAPGTRRHHSSHSLRSNIFRINLNGFYSPHPSTYSPNPSSFPPQPFYTCHPVHCNRKPERRQCGCSSKFQDTIDNIEFYRGYPPTTSLYHHLPNSYPLPSPSQFTSHQSQHFFLNPARFHRRRNRLMRDEGMGGEEPDSARGSPHLGSGFTSSFSCGCGRSEHKHKHKHRHRHCGRDLEEDELIEDEVERDGFVSKQRSGFIYRQEEVGRKASRGLGSVLSKKLPWLRENGGDTFSSVAASSSTERFKQTPLAPLGMGSTHLFSFGGGWGGLEQSWTKYSGLGGAGFGNPSWTGFNSEKQHTSKTVSTGREDEDDEESSFYRTSPPPGHTNLFTSTAMTGGRGLRSGLVCSSLGSGEDRPWRRDDPVWMERREAGLQSDSRNSGQHKTVQPPDNGLINKRRPGRPRKHPLPSAVPLPGHSSSTVFMPPLEVQPGHRTDSSEAMRTGARAEPAQQMTEGEQQAKRKKGLKRIHSTSPSCQSVTEDKPEQEIPSEGFDYSTDVDRAQAQTVPIQREERTDRLPKKTFLKAGLYSDDYKTTDPPSQNQPFHKDSTESSSVEQEYSLLPAPIHVGKYLRLKRVHFQLPYDVMWLWRHHQLCRQPAVPLKRKRHYCRLKDKTLSSLLNVDENSGDITNLFPHLDMDPLTSSERSFVVKHHVFLLRNWELVRERQIRLRIERERERDTEEEEEEEEEQAEDDSHNKSDQPVGVISSDVHKSLETSSSLTASPSSMEAHDTQEWKEEDKRGKEELCSREQRRKRLNDLLLTLQHS